MDLQLLLTSAMALYFLANTMRRRFMLAYVNNFSAHALLPRYFHAHPAFLRLLIPSHENKPTGRASLVESAAGSQTYRSLGHQFVRLFILTHLMPDLQRELSEARDLNHSSRGLDIVPRGSTMRVSEVFILRLRQCWAIRNGTA